MQTHGLAVRLAGLACLTFAFGCEEPKQPEVKVKKSELAVESLVPPLFFLPASAPPRDGKLWLALARGAHLPGASVTELEEQFDYVPFRIAGSQEHLDPVRRATGYGVEVDVGNRRGGSLIGFQTLPRVVRGVRVLEYAKTCINVRRGVWEEPDASPAVAARFGWRLEIATEVDPLSVRPGESLILRVRFDGPGLGACPVVAEQLPHGATTPVEVLRTETGAKGELELPIQRAGLWRVVATHRVAAAADAPAQLHRSVLVFRTGGE